MALSGFLPNTEVLGIQSVFVMRNMVSVRHQATPSIRFYTSVVKVVFNISPGQSDAKDALQGKMGWYLRYYTAAHANWNPFLVLPQHSLDRGPVTWNEYI